MSAGINLQRSRSFQSAITNRCVSRLAAKALLMFSLALSLPAIGAEGVLEINQTCAVQTGCFPGDPAGFPVTISQPGSYVLTSNLSVGPEPANGIEIEHQLRLRFESATVLDLNGFRLSGPGPTSSTTGIFASEINWRLSNSVLVQNGTVSRFSTAIDLKGVSRVEDVRVFAFSTFGIRAGDVRRCLVDEGSGPHTGTGIDASGTVEQNRVSAGKGIQGGMVVEINNISAASLGISSPGRVTHNRVISGGAGLVLSGTSTYEGNLIESESTPLSGGGTDEGGNVCNGALCPAVTALVLRNANTDARVKSVESGDIYSLAAVGGCLAIQVDLNETATSLRYDWKAPGQAEVVAYRSENNAPFVWAAESGWLVAPEVANCGCSAEMSQIGEHKLVFTPCSVDVNFGAGQTCAGNGGVEGNSRTVFFELEP